MNSNIEKNCAMCRHSRPDPKSRQVFCAAHPPTVFPMMSTNPITQRPDIMFVSVLPEILTGCICGEFEFDSPAQAVLCQK